MCNIFLPDRERALQEERGLSQSEWQPRHSQLVDNSQGKQRLLQSGAADYDIPKGVAQRLHVHMEGRLVASRSVWSSRIGEETGGINKAQEVMAGSENLYEVSLEVGPASQTSCGRYSARLGARAIWCLSA